MGVQNVFNIEQKNVTKKAASNDAAFLNLAPPSVVRQDQFAQIENYISGANRSFDEMFFIAGDLNVAKDSQEFLQ